MNQRANKKIQAGGGFYTTWQPKCSYKWLTTDR